VIGGGNHCGGESPTEFPVNECYLQDYAPRRSEEAQTELNFVLDEERPSSRILHQEGVLNEVLQDSSGQPGRVGLYVRRFT
jgi:hypothetical protein